MNPGNTDQPGRTPDLAGIDTSALEHRFPDDTPQRMAARALIDNGSTQRDASEAVGVSNTTISTWVRGWRRQGWRHPNDAAPTVVPAAFRTPEHTAPARAVLQQRWSEHRERVGLTAGLLASRCLQLVSELLPQAGQPQTIVEQAVDDDGRPRGAPRHRVIVPVPSIEVYRLAESAKTLFALADRSAGLAAGDVNVQVNQFGAAPLDVGSEEERRRVVLDVLARMPELPDGELGDR